MVERNLNATQLCNGAHLTHSLVSRLLSGQNTISRARLSRLTAFFYKRSPAKDAGRLVAAHLRDVATGIKGAEFVAVDVSALNGVEHHID